MPERQLPPSANELVHRVNQQLESAVSVARAAKTSAEAGDAPRALAILRDVEPLLFEVMTLLNAASLMRGNQR